MRPKLPHSTVCFWSQGFQILTSFSILTIFAVITYVDTGVYILHFNPPPGGGEIKKLGLGKKNEKKKGKKKREKGKKEKKEKRKKEKKGEKEKK